MSIGYCVYNCIWHNGEDSLENYSFGVLKKTHFEHKGELKKIILAFRKV